MIKNTSKTKCLSALGLSFICFALQSSAHASTCKSLLTSSQNPIEMDSLKPLDKSVFDIRTYTNPTAPRELRSQYIKISNPKVTLNLGIGQINASTAVLNMSITDGYDSGYTTWVRTIVENQFSDLLVKGSSFDSGRYTLTARIKIEDVTALEKRFKNLQKLISSRGVMPPEVIPSSIRKKSQSERVTFIRTLLTNFLAQSGVSDKELFYERYLPVIHRTFLNSLNSAEISVFHYSMFDQDMSIENQIEISERVNVMNETQKALGLPQIETEQLVSQIREKMTAVAQAFADTFNKEQEKMAENLELTKDFRA